MPRVTSRILGIFDTDQGRLIGVTPNGGASDPTYLIGQDSSFPADATPVAATTNPATGGIGISSSGEDLTQKVAAAMFGKGIPARAAGLLPAVAQRGTGPLRMSAVIKNPVSVAYGSHPCGIHVEFSQGQVPTADYLKILDDSSAYIAFQWEADSDLRAGGTASLGTWPDGSLRAGKLWVNVPSLAVAQSRTYTIEIYNAAQGQSFTSNVSYAVVSAGVSEKFDTTGYTYQFEAAQGWLLRRLYDKSISNEDYFTSQNGICVANKISASTTSASYTASDITQVSYGQRNSTAFGYGVVFREWESVFTWNSETGMKTSVRFRVYANGMCDVYHRTATTGAIASADRGMWLWVRTQSTGLTTSDIVYPSGRVRAIYANKRILSQPIQNFGSYEATPAGTHSSFFAKDGIGGAQYGWSATTAAPSGAYWGALITVAPMYTSGDEDGTSLRLRNRLYSRATELSPTQINYEFSRRALALISDFVDWYPAQGDTNWMGCYALALLTLRKSGHWAAYQSWYTGQGITKSAGGLYAYWNSGKGIQYICRNTQYLYSLYKLGMATSEAIADIHMVADFIVTLEAASGGDGFVMLTGSLPDNYNAEASAIRALAASLAITPDATRQACYARIKAKLAAGAFGENWWPYDNTSGSTTNLVIRAPATHYLYYTLFEAITAFQIKGDAEMQTNIAAPIYLLSNAVGQINEPLASANIDRRGAMSTQLYAAACLMLSSTATASDKRHAVALMDNVLANRIPTNMWQSPAEGWSYNGGIINSAMDVRTLCECVLS